MTRQPPSPQIILTERAFQIYLSLLNTDLDLPYSFEEEERTPEKVLSGLKKFARLSFEAAEVFIDFSVNQDDANTEALMEFVDPTQEESFEPIE